MAGVRKFTDEEIKYLQKDIWPRIGEKGTINSRLRDASYLFSKKYGEKISTETLRKYLGEASLIIKDTRRGGQRHGYSDKEFKELCDECKGKDGKVDYNKLLRKSELKPRYMKDRCDKLRIELSGVPKRIYIRKPKSAGLDEIF